jgi:hypothetical protein
LEIIAKLLKSLERFLADFSKCALKLLDNHADFDSAIRRFESSRPSQALNVWFIARKCLTGLGDFAAFGKNGFRHPCPQHAGPAYYCVCRLSAISFATNRHKRDGLANGLFNPKSSRLAATSLFARRARSLGEVRPQRPAPRRAYFDGLPNGQTWPEEDWRLWMIERE